MKKSALLRSRKHAVIAAALVLAMSLGIPYIPVRAEEIATGTDAEITSEEPEKDQEVREAEAEVIDNETTVEERPDSGSEDTSAENDALGVSPEKKAALTYQAHVQNIGWMNSVSAGQTAGTSGRSLRVEALKFNLTGDYKDSYVSYRSHVQNIGWESSWKKSGQVTGTSGRSLRVEAVEIKLNGSIADDYDIYYRTHVQNAGWLGWVKNGAPAGSQGFGLRVEAVQAKLVKKGESIDAGGAGFSTVTGQGVSYETHVQNIGWTSAVKDGKTGGTTGRSLRVEALKLNLYGFNDGSGIQYKTHIQNIGWEKNWHSNGQAAGTSGRSLRVEAVQIKLTGPAASKYNIYYRVHVQNIGWMGWAMNGGQAGTSGGSLRVESIQVKLVPKAFGGAGTGNAFRKIVPFNDGASTSVAQGISSRTNYLITVNRGAHRVCIYTGSRGSWRQIKGWDCVVGNEATPTTPGLFSVGAKGRYFDSPGYGRCWYYTQIHDDYFFHSQLYEFEPTPAHIRDGAMGVSVSHGCVRLHLENAKWIQDNIPVGTAIYIFN